MADPAEAAREAASVRKVTESERPEVVAALARAFYDDPVLSWLFPDDSRRAGQLERGFGLFGRRLWFPQEESYTTDSVAGGALWMAPDGWRQSAVEQLTRLPRAARAVGLRDLPRLMRTLNLIEKKHPHETHFYLPIIGVSPEWQGKGIGTALLRPVLERCDSEGIPAYLEASSPRNRACYERNGFAVIEELRMPGGGPPWWAMWRAARAS